MAKAKTIRFNAKLIGTEKVANLTVPKSAKLPAQAITIEGTINGFPFRSTLKPDEKGTHVLKVNKALRAASGAKDTVTVEITRVEEESEIRVPLDLQKALAENPKAQAAWEKITPMARRDWVLFLSTAKLEETRAGRIKKACNMLAQGKGRVCCFPGLNWLTKDHPMCETWAALPKTKK